jgi:hypothetical protein
LTSLEFDKKDRPDERGLFDVHGVISAVSVKDAAIDVVGGGEGDPWVKTFTLPKDFKAQTKMERFSRDLTIADLHKATRVSIKLAEDKKTVAKMVVHLPLIRFNVKSVDAAKGTISGGEESFTVDKGTQFWIHGKAGALADVTPGMRVIGWLSPDRSRLIAVQAFRPDAEREDGRRDPGKQEF